MHFVPIVNESGKSTIVKGIIFICNREKKVGYGNGYPRRMQMDKKFALLTDNSMTSQEDR